MKPIYILLILAITIFAGCNKNKTDADLLYTDTVWAYVSDNPFYVMEDTTVWENGEPFLQNGMEYSNVSETELCNVEKLISSFLKKEKCKVMTKRHKILDNYFKQCIGFKCKQTRFPPQTHNIYNLVLMVNITAQTVEWYNPQKK